MALITETDNNINTQPASASTHAAIDFIKLLFEPGDLLCFGFLDGSKNWKQVFRVYEIAIQPEFIAKLQESNEAGNNIYIAMNAYQSSKRTEKNVSAVRTVWAEIDDNGRENLNKVFASTILPEPSIVTETSPNKFHAIWKTENMTVEEAKALLKAICTEFNGDSNAIDAARVLRLPGFVNRKYEDRPEVEVVHLSDNTSRRALSEFRLAPEKTPNTPAPLLKSSVPPTRGEEQTAKLIAEIFAKGQQVLEGGRNANLTSVAGKLHNLGLSLQDLEYQLSLYNDQFHVPPLDSKEVRTIACSIDKTSIQDPVTVLINGRLPGEAMTQPETKTRELLIDDSDGSLRPVFPYHVMEGTSLYEGLVRPVVDNSSKHAEFVFMPAVQMMLNYLSGKVTVAMQDTSLNLYIGLISPPGEFFKSSSCMLAHDYFKSIGLAIKYSKSLPSADGRIVVMQTGSSEGFGTALSGLNGKHAILFNDELGKLVAKAGIENSSLPHDLLTWYESGEFGNTIKSKKESFAFEANTYCFGWQWCTTTRGFNRHWPKIAGAVSGMEDRMFFVISPEKSKCAGSYSTPQTKEAAKRTFELIEKALLKATYHFASYEEVQSLVYGMNPRTMQMLFALALYFAIDLNREKIDAECLQRAKQLVDFRDQAISFLAPIEADNEQGRMQQEITRELRQHRGKMKYRDLCRDLNANRFGSDRWRAGYKGLVGEGIIADWEEKTKSGQKTRMTALLVLND
jgi:RepB DNA-primase from phage plasmid/Primase C terminal 1 (PriCT-1)